jgi:hypothetical protein
LSLEVSHTLLLTADIAVVSALKRSDMAEAALALISVRARAPKDVDAEPAAHTGVANPTDAHAATAVPAIAKRTERFISGTPMARPTRAAGMQPKDKSARFSSHMRNVWAS